MKTKESFLGDQVGRIFTFTRRSLFIQCRRVKHSLFALFPHLIWVNFTFLYTIFHVGTLDHKPAHYIHASFPISSTPLPPHTNTVSQVACGTDSQLPARLSSSLLVPPCSPWTSFLPLRLRSNQTTAAPPQPSPQPTPPPTHTPRPSGREMYNSLCTAKSLPPSNSPMCL